MQRIGLRGQKRKTENELSSYPNERISWIKHHQVMVMVVNGHGSKSVFLWQW